MKVSAPRFPALLGFWGGGGKQGGKQDGVIVRTVPGEGEKLPEQTRRVMSLDGGIRESGRRGNGSPPTISPAFLRRAEGEWEPARQV